MATEFQPLKTTKHSLPLQAKLYLESLIQDGAYQPGQQLPSQEQLAEQLGISRATLREALHRLEIDGVIRRQHGVGTFVTSNYRQCLDTGLEVLESLERTASKIGLHATMGMLQVDVFSARPIDRERLGLAIGDEVINISRVMLVDNRPVAYLIDMLSTRILNAGQLKTGFNGSVLDLLLSMGRPPLSHSNTKIETVTASDALASALRVQRKAPLLKFEACLYAKDGQVVDYSISHFAPGYFNFHVVRRIEV